MQACSTKNLNIHFGRLTSIWCVWIFSRGDMVVKPSLYWAGPCWLKPTPLVYWLISDTAWILILMADTTASCHAGGATPWTFSYTPISGWFSSFFNFCGWFWNGLYINERTYMYKLQASLGLGRVFRPLGWVGRRNQFLLMERARSILLF